MTLTGARAAVERSTGRAVASGALAVSVALLGGAHPAAASSGPTVSVTPGAPFHSGETVTVSVGPNGSYVPHSRVSILECADPGGTAANLPKDDSTCDGNTIQADTVFVADDGSLSAAGYSLYQLPSTTLGEQPNGQPVCNATEACVLFVGEDQNDFTQAHSFSAPFTIAPATGGNGAPSGGSPGAAATGGMTTTTTGSGATGALAFTGGTTGLWWMGAVGGLLVALGWFGRRRSLRSVR